jgi:tetratricopeptide (TPR) repeat protein
LFDLIIQQEHSMAAANDPLPPGSVTASPPAPDAGAIQATAPPAAPAPSPSIPLPPRTEPRPAPLTDEEVAFAHGRLDGVLVAAVLLLAFLLSSFAVRNSDFWMHLATGRDIITGKYLPWLGIDPFAYTTQGMTWINHAWLYDLALFGLYSALGPTSVVVIKAILVTLLAWLMLRIRRADQSLWVPAACTGLAVLVMSPRLLLQPTFVSILFVGITLWLLYRENRQDQPSRVAKPFAWGSLWLLPPLFALWVNLDGWFLLGPITLALYLMGEVMQSILSDRTTEEKAEDLARMKRAAAVLIAGVAACLLNPQHVHAFTLPPELSFAQPMPELAKDHDLHAFFLSPWEEVYFNRSLGGSVAGVSYIPLVLLGLISFVLNGRRQQWWRVLIWLGFCLLSSYRWHAMPFFAVVAGPITALNFQDYAAKRRGATPSAEPVSATPFPWSAVISTVVVLGVLVVAMKVVSQQSFWTDRQSLSLPELPIAFLIFAGAVLGLFWLALAPFLSVFDQIFLRWGIGGRLLTVVACLVLLLAAWPGWLQASRQDPAQVQRVAWTVETDGSLKQAAEWLQKLHEEKALTPEIRGFNFSPQVAHYLAWFAPDERVFFDQRFPLFPEVGPEYLAIRGTLNLDPLFKRSTESAAEEPGQSTNKGPTQEDIERQQVANDKMRKLFRDHRINYVIVNGPEPLSTIRVMQHLSNDFTRWVPLYSDGRTSIFGWIDPDPTAPPQPVALWESLRLDPDQQAFGDVKPEDRSPPQAPPEPVLVPGWARIMQGTPGRSWKSDEAALDVIKFRARAEESYKQNLSVWQFGYAGGIVGSANPLAGPILAQSLLLDRQRLGDIFLRDSQHAPVARPNQLEYAKRLFNDFLSRQDDGPPALPLLAVRAARQAIAANPQDHTAYFNLQQAYATLRTGTRERVWTFRLPALDLLRQVQMVTALQHALTVQPDMIMAHGRLAELYQQFQYSHWPYPAPYGYVDLVLRHRQEELRLTRRAGRPAQEPEADYAQRLEDMQKAVDQLEKEVQGRRDRYETQSANKQVYQKAMLALRFGLAEQALEVLTANPVTEFGAQGARLQLELLLLTGRVDEAGKYLDKIRQEKDEAALQYIEMAPAPPGSPVHVVPAFAWLEFLRAAAIGDYAEADAQLEAITRAQDPTLPIVTMIAAGLPTLPVPAGLIEMPAEKPLAWNVEVLILRQMTLDQASRMVAPLLDHSDILVLRGLLALESGDTAAAEQHLREAIAICVPASRFLPMLSILGTASPLEQATLVPAGITASQGPAFDFNGRLVGNRLLYLIEEAKAKRRPPTP